MTNIKNIMIYVKKRTQKKGVRLNNLSSKRHPKTNIVPERLFNNFNFVKMFGRGKTKKRQ